MNEEVHGQIGDDRARDFAHLPIGVMLLDDAQCVVRVDRRFCELFACSSADLEGRPFDELLSSRDRRSVAAYYGRLNRYDGGILDAHMMLEVNGRDYYGRVRMKMVDRGWVVYVENTLVEQDLTYQLVV